MITVYSGRAGSNVVTVQHFPSEPVVSRLARAIEILEAMNAYFQEGGEAIYADALLLGDDVRIKDAILDCLGPEETVTHVSRNRRRHYGQNVLGHWVGFVGKSKIRAHDFGVGQEAKEAAIRWVSES